MNPNICTTPGFAGMSFASMSNEYLVESFDELCERTAESRPNNEDWLEEWRACKDEVLSRMNTNS